MIWKRAPRLIVEAPPRWSSSQAGDILRPARPRARGEPSPETQLDMRERGASRQSFTVTIGPRPAPK